MAFREYDPFDAGDFVPVLIDVFAFWGKFCAKKREEVAAEGAAVKKIGCMIHLGRVFLSVILPYYEAKAVLFTKKLSKNRIA